MVGVLRVATWMHAVVLAAPAGALPEGEAGFATEEAAAPNTSAPSEAVPALTPSSVPTAAPVASSAPAAPPAPAPSARVEGDTAAGLEPSKPAPKPSRWLSLTFSPLHLLMPVVEVEAELQVVPHFGLGFIGGIGSINAEAVDSSYPDQTFSVYELGGQVLGYPLRDFSSLQLGAEVMWLHVSTATYEGASVEANAGGVAVGPLVGYKVLTDGGFTFVAQAGFQYVAVQARASDNQGNSARADDKDIIPLLNLNLGWSF